MFDTGQIGNVLAGNICGAHSGQSLFIINLAIHIRIE